MTVTTKAGRRLATLAMMLAVALMTAGAEAAIRGLDNGGDLR